MSTRALVIIEAAHLADARNLLLQPPFSHTAEEAADTFVPAGSASGAGPASHWWLSAALRDESWTDCEQMCGALGWAQCFAYDLAAAPGFPEAKLNEMGLKPLMSVIP